MKGVQGQGHHVGIPTLAIPAPYPEHVPLGALSSPRNKACPGDGHPTSPPLFCLFSPWFSRSFQVMGRMKGARGRNLDLVGWESASQWGLIQVNKSFPQRWGDGHQQAPAPGQACQWVPRLPVRDELLPGEYFILNACGRSWGMRRRGVTLLPIHLLSPCPARMSLPLPSLSAFRDTASPLSDSPFPLLCVASIP